MRETSRHLIRAFEFIKEKLPVYYFYVNVTYVQFFTLNRLGYWLYFLAVIFLFQDSAFYLPLSSFFLPRNMLIRLVLVASFLESD